MASCLRPACLPSANDIERSHMFLAIGILLVLAWLTGFVFLHVTSFAIHVLLLFALVSIVVHFVRGRST